MRDLTKNMQEILDEFAKFRAPPLETLTPDAARNLPTFTDAVNAVIGKHITKRAAPFPEPVGKVEHVTIPSKEGDLLARVYTPFERNHPLPVLLYFHGGGWVIANLDTYDASCRALCKESEFIVVSVAYRQAPEHPFPAATNDALTAYRWILKNAGSFGGSSNLVAIGGESAGANLAAVTCIQARDLGLQRPIHQLLVYPVTDLTFGGKSHQEHADAKPLNELMMHWFKRHYLQHRADPTHPHVSPFFADLERLPPATIITAEIDPLCTDGEMYAKRLRARGVPVKFKCFSGVTHEFFGAKALLPEAREAMTLACYELKQAATQSTAAAA